MARATPKRIARQSASLAASGATRARRRMLSEEASPDAVAHVRSGTAVAAEALRTGIPPAAARARREEIPHEGEAMRVGDPDESALDNEYVGEDVPGGAGATPDQNVVDDIGRAYGLAEEDTHELHTSFEMLSRRDRHRAELTPPRRPRP